MLEKLHKSDITQTENKIQLSSMGFVVSPPAVWECEPQSSIRKGQEVLEQNKQLFIGVFVSEILDKRQIYFDIHGWYGTDIQYQ